MLEGEDDIESLYVHFAEFEEFCKEPERARAIYKYALDHVSRDHADGLYSRFVVFEKKHGDRGHIEDVLLSKKRLEVRRPAPPPHRRCAALQLTAPGRTGVVVWFGAPPCNSRV